MGTKLDTVINYLKKHPTVTSRKAREFGVSRHELKLWTDSGKVHRINYGVYSLSEANDTPEEIIATIKRPCALAGITALVHYGYTNVIEQKTWVLIPLPRPRILRKNVETMRQKPNVFKVGLTTIQSKWGPIQIVDREKAVLDALRGQFLDDEEKFRVLKRWRNDPKRSRENLGRYSKAMRMNKDIFNWLAFLEADE
jgi:predicted transcriptional regulator of viral defense system